MKPTEKMNYQPRDVQQQLHSTKSKATVDITLFPDHFLSLGKVRTHGYEDVFADRQTDGQTQTDALIILHR